MGTRLDVFDARRDTGRDLQGDIDIGLHRSTDGGNSWDPIRIPMDMGEWGGLPEKFNGVSDACILVDQNSDAIYIAGLWMYGVLDTEGNWVEGRSEEHTSELQSLMRISYAVFCLKKQNKITNNNNN